MLAETLGKCDYSKLYLDYWTLTLQNGDAIHSYVISGYDFSKWYFILERLDFDKLY